MKRRLTAAVLFLLIGAAAIAYGISTLFGAQTGWVEIEAESSGGPSLAGEFTLLYDIGRGGVNPTAERRAVTTVYSNAVEKAWRLLSNVEIDGENNLRALNDHPNEVMTVDAAIYRALERIEASGNRTLYLAPVAEIYNGLFTCADDALAGDFDPLLNDDLRAFFVEAAAYARDPSAVRVELLGENQVRLYVSEAYMAFAKTQEIGAYLDFQWMLNAFAADMIADELAAHQLTAGALSSQDGFSRALDASGSYSLAFFDGRESPVVQAATLRYTGPMSVVYLRGYPAVATDTQRFYTRRDGTIRTAYLDASDGLDRAAAMDLVAYSSELSCAETLLRVMPVFIADELDETALTALSRQGVQSVFFREKMICCTDAALDIGDLLGGERGGYAVSPVRE